MFEQVVMMEREISFLSLLGLKESIADLAAFLCSLHQLPEVEVCLDDPKATIFSYVQKVALAAGISKNERVRRVWEPTYT